jgi:hypothetical protein
MGDPASTAASIAANETRFRAGFVADLISGVSYVGVTGLLFFLLAGVDRSVSFVAACFGICGVAIGGASYVLEFMPLVLLRGAHLASFSGDQLQAVALAALSLRMQVFSMGMMMFGIQCFLVGWLTARSTFLPKALGVLLSIGGSAYVAIALLNFLVPSYGARMTPFFMPIALVGEGAMAFYLLFKGVKVERWAKQ